MFLSVAGSALGPAARWLTRGRARILFYHRFGSIGRRAFDPARFAQHLEYLRRHFNPIHLTELAARLDAGEPAPPYAVVVTVDDGYQDFADLAYPQLVRYEVPATLFVVSRFACAGVWLWYDRLRYVLEHSSVTALRVSGPDGWLACPLGTPADRERAWDRIATRCLTLPTVARDALIGAISRELGVDVPATLDPAFMPMGVAALKSLDAALIDVGAHTRTHPILSQCTDAELHAEIVGGREELQAALGRPVRSFCYPNGFAADFDERAIATVRAAGFQCAVASYGSLVSPRASVYALPRFSASADPAMFRREVDGLSHLRAALRRGMDGPAAGPPRAVP